MLEQHPVPQNVTTFQFRLIGDMTIKQFGYLAAGVILAYISYNLPLPFFFTWPLTAIFALGGVGFAFVPVEERPMDVWFLSFIKSVYSPTLYIWQREAPIPEPVIDPATGTVVKKTSFFSRFLIPLPQPPHLKGLQTKASLVQTPAKETPHEVWQSFSDKKAVHQNGATITQQAQKPQEFTTVLPSRPLPTIHPDVPARQPTQGPVQQSAPPVIHQQVQQQQPLPQQPIQQPAQKPKSMEERLKELEDKLAEEQKNRERIAELERTLQESLAQKNKMLEELQSLRQDPGKQPSPLPEIPLPGIKPTPQPAYATLPNGIRGVVRQQTGEVLSNILVTIKDKDDIPVRAMKTSKTGQFATSTSLVNGQYTVEVEDPKKVFFFNPTPITLNGETLPLVEVVAKTKQQLERIKLEQALFGKNND